MLQKRIPTKTKGSEAKCLLGGKRIKYPWLDTQTGSERIPQAQSFESLSWGNSSGFFKTNHLVCLVLSQYLIYLSPPVTQVYVFLGSLSRYNKDLE